MLATWRPLTGCGGSVGKGSVIIKSTENERRLKFEQAVEAEHMLAVRTSEAMKKLVLVDTLKARKTELNDYAQGQVDPQLQLILIARDEFLAAEDAVGKLGFYRSMRDVMLSARENNLKWLTLAMQERHHREKIALMEQKLGSDEPSDAEVDAAMKDGDAP